MTPLRRSRSSVGITTRRKDSSTKVPSTRRAEQAGGRMDGTTQIHPVGVLGTSCCGTGRGYKPKTPLEETLELFSDKGKSKREKALAGIIEELTKKLQHDLVEDNFATILYWCLVCIKNGSARYLQLAPRAIGLTAMILRDIDLAHEVWEESLPVLAQALKPGSNSMKILDCLAIVSYFGAVNSEETERAMQVILEFLNPETSSDTNLEKQSSSMTDLVSPKHSAAVLASAISAWSLLLATMEGWRLNQKTWKGTVSYLSNILDREHDESVCLAAAMALTLIFEIGCLEKFSSEAKNSSAAAPAATIMTKLQIKDAVTRNLRRIAEIAREEGADKEAEREWKKTSSEILKFFEYGQGKSVEIYVRLGNKNGLVLHSWSQAIQLKFFKNFLGEDGFRKHMKENENLQMIFECTQTEECNSVQGPEREEVKLRFFQHQARRKKDDSMLQYVSSEDKKLDKRMTMSPSSFLNKARSQLRKKLRAIAIDENMHDDH